MMRAGLHLLLVASEVEIGEVESLANGPQPKRPRRGANAG